MPSASAALTIRSATLVDLDALVDLQCALTEETEHLAADRDLIRRGVGHLLGSVDHGRYIVAVDAAGMIVGCLMLLPEWSTWQAADIWWIHDVYVRHDWRRQGVFRLLYEHLLAQVRANPGVIGLRLYVASDNVKAQRTYQELGMRNDRHMMYERMLE